MQYLIIFRKGFCFWSKKDIVIDKYYCAFDYYKTENGIHYFFGVNGNKLYKIGIKNNEITEIKEISDKGSTIQTTYMVVQDMKYYNGYAY